jgi:hypothetical protein
MIEIMWRWADLLAVGYLRSCRPAGEDDEKGSQIISEIQKFSLANRPKSVH